MSAYGGYLEFTLEFTTAQGQGNFFRETDVEIIVRINVFHISSFLFQNYLKQFYFEYALIQ